MKIKNILLQIESSRGFTRDLLSGIIEYANEHDDWRLYSSLASAPQYSALTEMSPHFWKELKKFKPDGIITRDLDDVGKIVKLHIPTIIAFDTGKDYPGVGRIAIDNEAVMDMAVEYLMSHGYRDVAFCGFNGLPWSDIRRGLFIKKARKAGLNLHVYETNVSSPEKLYHEQEQLADWLRSLPKPTGLMLSNDDRYSTVLLAAKMSQLRIPKDIGVLGIDNDKLICNLYKPRLSSIALSTKTAGYKMAESLDNLIGGHKSACLKIEIKPTHLVTRESLDLAAIEDQIVAQALNFINANVTEVLQVSDVAEAVNVSVRILQKRFKQSLGVKISDEIRRIRVNKIAELLVETNLTILEIALKMGFNGINHVARYFHLSKGVSMQAYRKLYSRG